MIRLPNDVPTLIRLAIWDLRKAEESPLYEVYMRDWHTPVLVSHCSVCLAGSVMAFSLDSDIFRILAPSDFDDHTSSRLCALDSFRRGQVGIGYLAMKQKCPLNLRSLQVTEYAVDKKQFKIDMLEMADMLEGAQKQQSEAMT